MQEHLKTPTLFRVLGALSFILALLITFAAIANWARNPESFYIAPRDAVDWAGWATGMGALGTTGALIYAALKFRSDADEQRNLRVDRDAEAKAIAMPLKVDVSAFTAEEHSREVIGVRLELTNRGKERFTDIQVKVPDISAVLKRGRSAPIPADIVEDDPSFGREEEDWADVDPPIIAEPESKQIWLCGDISPHHIIELDLRFDVPQSMDDWEPKPPAGHSGQWEREGRIVVIFTDHKGHTWVRSTEGRQPLQRLWPDAFIVEQHRPGVH
ncbi:hypothetical protein [Nesterenkonia sp. Act20]|uniref:hypothetical protein n=1 Tax=Nesterenkonia sp. Act20 TaxID=1483432 RepID=UPI001C472F12|nr:hypothetical protein [Nesterenkonia sp. Act20]